jgi:signal transduction histidine kinase
MLLKWVDEFKNYILSENYSDPDEIRKISLSFYLLFYGGSASLILPLVYLAIGFPIGLIFSVFGSLLAMVLLGGIRRGISYIIIGNFCAFSLIVLLGAFIYFTGGIFSPALIWLLFAPVIGYMLTNNSSGKFWSFITLIVILILAFSGFFGFPFPNFIGQKFWPLVMAVNFVFSISILLLIVFSYENKQKKVVMELEVLNKELMSKTLETEELNKGLEKKVLSRTEELQRINAELDHFSYSISHNLRAPLTSILGLVELSSNEPENAEKYLELIKDSTVKLDGTIHNINSYLKINRGRIEKKEFLVWEILNEIIKGLSYSKMARDIHIDLKVGKETKIFSDLEKFRIVFSNIISNAIKYRDTENDGSFIRVKAEENGKNLRVSVSDNGIGIEKAKHEKIFDMFYRGTEKSQGDGLGLYIVKEALSSLEGNIVVESSESEGANFVVSLPK